MAYSAAAGATNESAQFALRLFNIALSGLQPTTINQRDPLPASKVLLPALPNQAVVA